MATKCANEDPASKTIRISFATYQDLAKLGTFGDNFDSVIRSLLVKGDVLQNQKGSEASPMTPQNQQTQSATQTNHPSPLERTKEVNRS